MFELLALVAAIALSLGTDTLRTALPAGGGATAIDLGFFEVVGLGLLALLVILRRRLG